MQYVLSPIKQLTYREADEIADKAVDQARGFSPATGEITISIEEILEFGRKSARVALELAGNLNVQKAQERIWTGVYADDARRRQDEFEKGTRRVSR